MKVLQINAVYGFLSTGIIAKDICDMLEKNGEQFAVATQKTNVTADNIYVVGNKLDWKYHALHTRIFGKQGYASKGATKNLLKWIDKEKPDVVHLHNLHSNYINFNMLCDYLAKNEIPTVITLHDCWYYTGKCCHYTNDKCYKWQAGCGNCIRLHKDNKSWFIDKTAEMWKTKRRLYDNIPSLTIIGVSDWIVNEAKKAPLFENARMIKRIYNGINDEVFYPHESNVRELYNLENKNIVLAVAGGWSESKGINDILRLSTLLDDSYRIVLIGVYNGEIPQNMINIPVTHNQKELSDWYAAADVFITMSKEESFGNVSAEALMCGAPIVCFDSTANPELVGENCGYVCQSDEVEEFKELVEKVINKGKKSFTESCVEFSKKNFGFDQYLNTYLELYRELLTENKK